MAKIARGKETNEAPHIPAEVVVCVECRNDAVATLVRFLRSLSGWSRTEIDPSQSAVSSGRRQRRVLCGWPRAELDEADRQREGRPAVIRGAVATCGTCRRRWRLVDPTWHAWAPVLTSSGERRAATHRIVTGSKRAEDPDDLAKILERILTLAAKAQAQLGPAERSLAPGLELVAWSASQLSSALVKPWIRGEYRERHKEALRLLVGMPLEGERLARVERIIQEATEIGWVHEQDEKGNVTGKRIAVMTEPETDTEAVRLIRQRLAMSFGVEPTDATILKVLRLYRRPVARRGRPRKDEQAATTETERVEALAALLRELGIVVGDTGDVSRVLRNERPKISG